MQVTGRRWRMPFARWMLGLAVSWSCLGSWERTPRASTPRLPRVQSVGICCGRGRMVAWSLVRVTGWRPLVTEVVSRGGRKQEHGG
ncbi:hypothetical protein QBC39DRAFT_356500 [Podospora conica]|nr:hypothetical protein QBC39DRAFT_356500 [Schizothecium conicum]